MNDQPQPGPTREEEERVRRLLVAAAETVQVDLAPAPSSRPGRRPIWPLVAAAATVAVVVVGIVTVFVEGLSQNNVEPAPAPTTVTVPSESPEPNPTERTPAEPTAQQRAVAESFAAFAGGGPPPAFATSVRLLLGSKPVATVTGNEAAEHSAWVLPCDVYAERVCPIDPLAPVATEKHLAITGTIVREPSACHVLRGDLPADLTEPAALARSVSLSVPEPTSCIDAWELQLWLNDDGAILAANLLLGGP